MADERQVSILRQGAEAWNAFIANQGEPFRADLSCADLAGTDLSRAALSGADLFRADLTGANLTGVRLFGASLTNATLAGANLTYARLTDAILTGARLKGANLTDASLSGTRLADANLTDATLVGTRLSDSDLSRATLKGATLVGADLTRASSTGANFSDADLGDARLNHADFTDANLSGASLTGARLISVTLTRANLAGTRVAKCRFGDCTFGSINLARAKGLSLADHLASSVLGTDTLKMSRGKIPKAFLKGCGLEDWEILNSKLYDPDLRESEFIDLHYELFKLKSAGPIPLGQIFLSYSRADSAFVDELYASLDAKGVRSWRDIHDAEAGPLEKVIDRAIRMNPVLLLVLSKASCVSSWIRYEIQKAISLEAELDRHVLCPVAIDEAWKTKLPPHLRAEVERYNILDLSGEGAIERQMLRILEGLHVHYRKPEQV